MKDRTAIEIERHAVEIRAVLDRLGDPCSSCGPHPNIRRAMSQKKANLIYISGAITGATQIELQQFNMAEAYLVAQGYDVINPRKIDAPLADENYDAYCVALARDIGIICSPQCIGIAILDSWFKSKGARWEVFNAVGLNRRIIALPHQSLDFIDRIIGWVDMMKAAMWFDINSDTYAHHPDIVKLTVQFATQDHYEAHRRIDSDLPSEQLSLSDQVDSPARIG